MLRFICISTTTSRGRDFWRTYRDTPADPASLNDPEFDVSVFCWEGVSLRGLSIGMGRNGWVLLHRGDQTLQVTYMTYYGIAD